ncbi:uncharacterized protein B0H18DRAFT_989579 [Fomitopsis serialis]|uniref:uncharacterized protein n=1 Tax=Fomitopsis serialis TaxID=139415 RepID=UPI00200762EE|nr:uncharacterized protein B0H18DRAFT_989579 [Neoantrodia serialis]KAH9931487.1 hypothetical protein B0H18DRAFT_989579 [Neoantrodia serialis]
MLAYDAIYFPADGRPPCVVSLKATPLSTSVVDQRWPFQCGCIPHPEMYMEKIAEGLVSRSWRFQIADRLDCMNRTFATPYVIFYPTVSRDGMPFRVNKCAKELHDEHFVDARAWRGDIIVAKFRDEACSSMMDASMADFPILKIWLSQRPGP